ncbi:MAG: hypothetical protein IKW26_02100 [Treponema sp.]|nr:hypothetical protein [Treponema sp.]
MGFFRKTKGSIISDAFMLIEDHANLKAKLMYDIALYEEYLTIKLAFGKQEATLSYNQITDIFYGMETEIINEKKSSIGRAFAGGLLFGGVGAIVGAVSGTGTKEKKKRHFYFIISYTSSNGEEKIIQFEDTRLYRGTQVAKKLKELCKIQVPESVQL